MSNILPRNEHTVDRVIRVLAGLALLSLVWIGPETSWGWLGLVPLVTGLVGRCPVYRLFGISTCSIGTHTPPKSPTGT